jgi:hypothetical protein
MSGTLRTDLASGSGATLIGYTPAGSGAVQTTAALKFDEVRTFEDFGAVGDFQSSNPGAATDDTSAVQAAIDWCWGGGVVSPRAILMTAKNFLVGNITTYPTTTIVGTGRHTSAFWCKPGTAGHWWSDRGNGAQKLMLHGIAFYGANNLALTAVGHFGIDGVQFGSEGVLSGLWFRDAPNGYGLACDANVGIFNDLTLQSCRLPLFILGNGNQGQNLFSMQAGRGTTGSIPGGPSEVVGMDVSGLAIRGWHVEAPNTQSLPIRIYGDCSLSDGQISQAVGTSFSHLVEVNTTNYDEWTVAPLSLPNGGAYTVTNGIFKIGNPSGAMVYRGGTNPNAFTGKSVLSKADVYSGELSLRDQLYQAFQIRIVNDGGTLKHRIGSLSDSGIPGTFCSKLVGASVSFSATPTGAAAFAGGVSLQANGGTLVLNTARKQEPASQTAVASLQYNTTGTDLVLFAGVTDYTVGGVLATHLAIDIRTTNGTPFNLTTMPAGSIIMIGVVGYIA